jgi:hypothetical protein
MRHGLPDDEREWSLAGIKRKARDKDTGPAVRQCAECFGVFGAATRTCPYCGRVAGLSPREVEEVAADLVEADRTLLQAAKRREVGRARTLEELQRVGAMRGFKSGWALHVWNARRQRHANTA